MSDQKKITIVAFFYFKDKIFGMLSIVSSKMNGIHKLSFIFLLGVVKIINANSTKIGKSKCVSYLSIIIVIEPES